MIKTTELDYQIEAASRSKEGFINFIYQWEIHTVAPWIIDWLDEYWTDHMSSIFFDTYWNGSLDAMPLFLGGVEFPSIVDDINRCIDFSSSNTV